jgi:hypothetical protein
MSHLVKEYDLGIVLENHSKESILKAVEHLVQNPPQAATSQYLSLFSDYSVSNIKAKLEKAVLHSLKNDGTTPKNPYLSIQSSEIKIKLRRKWNKFFSRFKKK